MPNPKKKFKDTTVGKLLFGAASLVNPALGNVLSGVTSPAEAIAAIGKSDVSGEDKIKLQQLIFEQQNKEIEETNYLEGHENPQFLEPLGSIPQPLSEQEQFNLDKKNKEINDAIADNTSYGKISGAAIDQEWMTSWLTKYGNGEDLRPNYNFEINDSVPDKETWDELKKGVKMAIHHSRDTAHKQWSETRSLALRGLSRVFKTCTKNLLLESWFSDTWTYSLLICKDVIQSASTEHEV